MTKCCVANILLGEKDCTGSPVVEVYGTVSTRYAVYRNERRIMIQFADDDSEGVNQRSALAPLTPLRSEISALLARLRPDRSAYQQRKFEEYGDRLGRSLLIALQGDLPLAQSELTRIRDEMVEDSASDVRTRHLMWAGVAVLATLLLATILASQSFAYFFPALDRALWRAYWQAAAVGSIGALFSIALQIRAREVPVDNQPWDNRIDAILRVFVGATSAVILIALFQGEFVDILVADHSLAFSPHGVVIAAFAGGFTERLVAEFLSRIGLAGRAGTKPATQAGVAANEQTIASGAPPQPPASGGSGQQSRVGPPDTPAIPQVTAEEAVEPEEDEDEATGLARDGQAAPAGQPVG